MRLLVIDGNSIANRAFFGIKLLTTKDGRYTNAIYGFLNILLSLLKECEPDEVAVAFDLKAPTFRHKMYDGYKAPATACRRSWPSRCRCSRSCWQTWLPHRHRRGWEATTSWHAGRCLRRPAG